MKHVFKSHEVAHVWAQQNQDEGRNAQRNFYFNGKIIFSYGSHFPIAAFVKPGVVLSTTKGYSNTTARQIHAVRMAINHLREFRGPKVPSGDYPGEWREAHNENVRAFIDSFPLQQKKAVKSRKYGEEERAALESMVANAAAYVAEFRKDIEKSLAAEVRKWERRRKAGRLFNEKELQKIRAVVAQETAAAKIENAERRAREAARKAEETRTKEENLSRWLAGESVSTWNLPQGVTALRINGETIETTRGASVPLIEARKFWNMLRRREPVEGMRLGLYTVNGITGDTLTVGCHQIPLKEVLRMARALKWADEITLEVQP